MLNAFFSVFFWCFFASLLLYSGCSFDDNERGCRRTDSHVCRSMVTEIFAMVSDREGVTLFMDPNGIEMFRRAVRGLNIYLSWSFCCFFSELEKLFFC